MKKNIWIIIFMIFLMPFSTFAEEMVDSSSTLPEEQVVDDGILNQQENELTKEDIIPSMEQSSIEEDVLNDVAILPDVQSKKIIVEDVSSSSEEIRNVKSIANVGAPQIGEHPSYLVGDNLISIREQVWINSTDEVVMSVEDVFEANKTYEYKINYVIHSSFDDSSLFDDLITSEYYANGTGSPSLIGDGWSDVQRKISFCMGEDRPPAYEYVKTQLDINLPEVGISPVYALESDTYSISRQLWRNITDGKIMTQEDVFEANKYYQYEVIFNTSYDASEFLK